MLQTKHKAHKFRIYPSPSQQAKLAEFFGSVRFVYNHYLNVKKQSFEESGQSLSYTACAKDLVSFKKEHSFLRDVDSIALQQSLRHLDTAFQNFFRNKEFGYPKYKSRKKHRDSYSTICVNGNIRLEGNSIVLPKIGKVRIRKHRQVPDGYILKSVTVSKTQSDKYFASILFEYETDIQPHEINEVIGLDFSMPKLFISSEDEIRVDERFLHYYRKSLDQLAKEQRTLSRRTKGSHRYRKQRKKIAVLHEKIANQRKDYLHKLSRQIANAYDLVCVEDLDMKGMSRALHFGKSVSDNSWGMFSRFLSYKLEDQGKALVKVNKWFPSSKTCHACGYVLPELSLCTREWECPECHVIHDRDKNAAINIKAEGMRIFFG